MYFNFVDFHINRRLCRWLPSPKTILRGSTGYLYSLNYSCFNLAFCCINGSKLWITFLMKGVGTENILSVYELPVTEWWWWCQRGRAAGCSVGEGGRDPTTEGRAQDLNSPTGHSHTGQSPKIWSFQYQMTAPACLKSGCFKDVWFHPSQRTATVVVFNLCLLERFHGGSKYCSKEFAHPNIYFYFKLTSA